MRRHEFYTRQRSFSPLVEDVYERAPDRMLKTTIIETPRHRLRPPTDDLEPLVAMVADPEVMQHVSLAPLPRASAEAAFTHYRQMLETKGYGYWVIDVNAGIILAGCKLYRRFHTRNRGRLVRLTRERWGNGYATEGGRADCFEQRSVTASDATSRHDARSARRLRSSTCPRHAAPALRALGSLADRSAKAPSPPPSGRRPMPSRRRRASRCCPFRRAGCRCRRSPSASSV